MTELEFFETLATLDYKWYKVGDKIRAEVDGKAYCPLTAVNLKVTGIYIDPSFPMTCARCMDLDRRIAAKIVQAIDNTHLSKDVVIIRQRLLEICDDTKEQAAIQQ